MIGVNERSIALSAGDPDIVKQSSSVSAIDLEIERRRF
jgi:hypothetical protein